MARNTRNLQYEIGIAHGTLLYDGTGVVNDETTHQAKRNENISQVNVVRGLEQTDDGQHEQNGHGRAHQTANVHGLVAGTENGAQGEANENKRSGQEGEGNQSRVNVYGALHQGAHVEANEEGQTKQKRQTNRQILAIVTSEMESEKTANGQHQTKKSSLPGKE